MWDAHESMYLNSFRQSGRIVLRRLDNSVMTGNSDPDEFLAGFRKNVSHQLFCMLNPPFMGIYRVTPNV